jgi:hypothetical protein
MPKGSSAIRKIWRCRLPQARAHYRLVQSSEPVPERLPRADGNEGQAGKPNVASLRRRLCGRFWLSVVSALLLSGCVSMPCSGVNLDEELLASPPGFTAVRYRQKDPHLGQLLTGSLKPDASWLVNALAILGGGRTARLAWAFSTGDIQRANWRASALRCRG